MHTRAMIAYVRAGSRRPRYYANDHSRDVLDIAPVEMDVTDARAQALTLDGAGFTLVLHRSAVADFADRAAVEARYRPEIVELVTALSGADLVLVNSPGIVRFSERSPHSGLLDNSRPARFAHVDVSDATAAAFAHRAAAPDLIAADAVFDSPGEPEWSFEGLVLAHAPGHRWHWFPDMHREEALIFKTHDSDPGRAHCVPHVAFDNSACAAHAPPRASIEMRALAMWFA